MQRPFGSCKHRSEQGYVLLTLMLFVALLTVAALAIAPTITFQIKRDREEELIHRGVQYSRAIRNYYKKFGRYPTNLKDLDSTNNQRFLRKHYKDPITGKDFKLLHFSEVQMMGLGGGVAGATPVTATTGAGGQALGNQGSSGGFSLGASTAAGTPTSGAQPQAGPESTSNPGSDSEQGTSPGGPGQIIGGPIVGVMSTSKDKSIREFGGKNHYNQWQFIYDPTMDRGTALLNTPAQPLLQGVGMNGSLQGNQPGRGGSDSSAPGASTGPSPQQTPSQSPGAPPAMPPEQ